MPLFRYTGRDGTGRGTAGKIEAANELDVAKIVEAAGYFVTSIEPAAKPAEVRKEKLPFIRDRITRRDMIVLLRQLATLYKAGVPIATGLDILERQTENKTLSKALHIISVEIREGLKLSEAFERHPKLFPPLVTANLLAGEETGALEEVLSRLAEHLEHEDELERFVKGALRYPAIVVVALIGVITMILLFVFPKMAPLFAKFGDDLPWPTKVLQAVGNNAAVYAPLSLTILGGAFVLFLFWKRSPVGRPMWEAIVLRIPKIGPVVRKILTARFARSFAVVFRTGVPLLRALEIVAFTLDHRILSKEIGFARLRMSAGTGIADALKGITIFPPLASHMLAVGEQTGRVDDLCTFVAEHYEADVKYELKNILSLIEPLLTAFLAVFVGFTALAMFMPMWSLMDVIEK